MRYIGARYVPVWYTNSVDQTSNWEVNVEYEPLTWVTTLNNHLYLSKKTVPDNIGTPASNPDYWLDMGVFTGQSTAELEQRVDDIENITIPAVQNSVKALEKNIIIIGNSYTTLGCGDRMAQLFDHAYTYTLGGSGFVGYTREPRTYEYCIDAAIADSDLDKDSITDILFINAVGEGRAYTEKGAATFESELDTNLSSIMTKIAANFPNCHNVMSTYAETRDIPVLTSPDSQTWNSLFAVHETFIRKLAAHKINYLGWSGFNTLFITSYVEQYDHYHPSASGAQVIGQYIVDSYQGQLQYRPLKQRKQVTFGYATGGTIYVSTAIYPDHAVIQCEAGYFSSGASVILVNGGSLLSLENLDIPLPMLKSNIRMYSALIQTTNGVRYDHFELSFIRNNDGKMTCLVANAPAQSSAGSIPLYIDKMNYWDYNYSAT